MLGPLHLRSHRGTFLFHGTQRVQVHSPSKLLISFSLNSHFPLPATMGNKAYCQEDFATGPVTTATVPTTSNAATLVVVSCRSGHTSLRLLAHMLKNREYYWMEQEAAESRFG